MYKKLFKRIIDFSLSLLGLVMLSPVFLLLWLWLSIANKGAGAFFTQERPGRNEKIFRVVKFKTMTDEKDANGNLLPAFQRLTSIGKIIRSLSLDELPQLLNVLNGDMSLIGPRPLRVEYLSLYSKEQSRRHNVRPGITGWAQINGRNMISWEEKFILDVWYVENVSFSVDLKILFLTFWSVLSRKGINQDNEFTSKPFKNIKLNG